MTFDIAIIGAGIIGAACAFRLSEEGFGVAVIEAKTPAGGTTGAGMGHLVVMDDSEAEFALTNYSQKLWRELKNQLPLAAEYQNCGTIWIAADDEEMQEVFRKRDFYRERGVEAEILDEKALANAEPNLRRGLSGGLRVWGDSVVYQPSVVKFLLEKAKVKLIRGKAFEINGNKIKLDDSTVIYADKIIIAAGIGSGDLFGDLKIRWKKGHLIITDRYPNFVRHQLIELGYLKSAHAGEIDSVAFNVQPRATHQVLIGSSRQFDVENKAVDYEILRQMKKRAFEYMPNLRKLSAVRVWSGFRPATPDNLPYIGQHPQFENVYLACGHEGLGITTSLGTAEILTDEIVGRESKIDRNPYLPERIFRR